MRSHIGGRCAIVASLMLAATATTVQTRPVHAHSAIQRLPASRPIAASYPAAEPLLHRSISVMQRVVRGFHGQGAIDTSVCCPRVSALARLLGDCIGQSTSLSVRATIRGTMLFGARPLVPIDFHFIARSDAASNVGKTWTRSAATHNTWQVTTKQNTPTRNADLIVYLCPAFLMGQISQHFPAHLVNLGPVNVHGVPAWHLQDRVAPTKGGFKGTVVESDYFLARSSLIWLRYESLYGSSGISQHVAVDFTVLAKPLTIPAPTVGASTP